MMAEQVFPKSAGTWTRCNNPIRNPVTHFFWKKPSYKYDFCDLCLYEIQKRNGTLPITQGYVHHKSPDSKPEKDSL